MSRLLEKFILILFFSLNSLRSFSCYISSLKDKYISLSYRLRNFGKLGIFVMSFLMAVLMIIAVKNILLIDGVEKVKPSVYIISGVIVFILSYISSLNNSSQFPLLNWETWVSISTNKGIIIASVFSSVFPMILRVSESGESQHEFSIHLYVYWLCGLSCIFFLMSYRIFAPKIYKFRDFDDFMKQSGTFLTLQKDANKILQGIKLRRNKNWLLNYELENLDRDLNILEGVVSDSVNCPKDAFYVFRYRAVEFYKIQKGIITSFFLIPAYLLPIVFISNVIFVALEFYKMVKGESLLKLIITG